MTQDFDDSRNFWNQNAADWRVQVGETGDRNRQLNSDPVLWAMLGDVAGKRVLDAGCGTGYLSRQLAKRGAVATGVDFSEQMIAIARRDVPGVRFEVDSCSELHTCANGEFDALVANYVLMDLADLDGACDAFYRVLRPAGAAVVIFSHPCFPAGAASITEQGVSYQWTHPYFEQTRRDDPPWGHFTRNFILFHRPLSDYWKSFTRAGFQVVEFEEPSLAPDRAHLASSEEERQMLLWRPYSVAFRLVKPA